MIKIFDKATYNHSKCKRIKQDAKFYLNIIRYKNFFNYNYSLRYSALIPFQRSFLHKLEHDHTHSANQNTVFQWSISHSILIRQVVWALKRREIAG